MSDRHENNEEWHEEEEKEREDDDEDEDDDDGDDEDENDDTPGTPHCLPDDDCVCCQGKGIAYVSDGIWGHCMECFGEYFPTCPPGCTLNALAKQYE